MSTKKAPKKTTDSKKGKNYSLKSIINKDKKKTVYKPILDNPFTEAQQTLWPEVTYNDQEQLQQQIIPLLEKLLSSENSSLPQLIKTGKITIGFNSTNKKLESQAQKIYKSVKNAEYGKSKVIKEKDTNLVRYVFVCKDDIHPSILYNHVPALCCTASINFHYPNDERKITLVTLPKNTKEILVSSDANRKRTNFIPIFSVCGNVSSELEQALKNCEAVKPLEISKYRRFSSVYVPTNAKILTHKT